MHQLPRTAPRSNTPARNAPTNPEQTNNSRDQPPTRSRSSVDLASYTERAGTEASGMASRNEVSGQDKETSRLNQIIQQFHTKAALMICSARADLPKITNRDGDFRQNKWFGIVINETDVLSEDLQDWRHLDLQEERPLPLVVEIYLDTAYLGHNQVLVITDENGRRFDVANALATSAESSPHPTKSGGRYCEVVLERWTIELGDPSAYNPAELDDLLPNVYKKGVVLFKSLYTFLRLLPGWKLYRKLNTRTGNHQGLKLKFRIRQGRGLAHGQKDSLSTPLSPSEHTNNDFVIRHAFEPLLTRSGPLHCVLDYRRNCAFGTADAEALISETLGGLDSSGGGGGFGGGRAGIAVPPTGRSLPGDRSERPRERYSSTAAPTTTTTRERPRALLGTYGSLGTFHAPNRRGSPVSELRQRALEDDDEEDDSDDMSRVDRIREEEGALRRRSTDYIANPPFKAGSLTSSPRPSPRPSPSPGTSAGRNESHLSKYGSAAATHQKRASLNTLPQQQLRTPSIPNETAVASSGSSSPKPAPVRYSSSFANRKNRFPSQGGKTAESNTSSGRGSSESKEKPENLNDIGQGSAGSMKTDDYDDIASFISDLEKSKDVKFHTPPSSHPNVVDLSKYSSMRDPSAQLAEEMSSSSLIQASGTPPSRRLSNVPGLSTSSSPSRVLTHAPHVRSRLSTHSVAEEASGASAVSGEGSDSPQIREVDEEEEDEPFIFPHHQDDSF